MVESENIEADPDPLQSTADVIEAARRPLVVSRHKDFVEAADLALADTDLDAAKGADPQALETVRAIADDDSLHTTELVEGMLEHACLARENGDVADAAMPGFLASCYRHIRDLLNAHQKRRLPILDLRTLPCGRVNRLLDPLPNVGFGSRRLADALVVTNSQSRRCLDAVRRLSKGTGGSEHWEEAAGAPALSREMEEPLEHLGEEERRVARERLVRDRIRHRFFKKVFLVYFDIDTLDPDEIAAHRTILDWLEAIEDTPHLFPFMQGQTQEQKVFRLKQLWRKVAQLNELYQRVNQASDHPTYREDFKGKGTRERLSILAKDRYPAIKVDDTFTIATAMCPFDRFAKWVQTKVGEKDFVLPPEPKR